MPSDGVLWPVLRRRRGILAAALGSAILIHAAGLPMPLVAREVLHGMTPPSAGETVTPHMSLTFGGLLLTLLAIARGSFRWLQITLGERLAQHVLRDLRHDMVAKLPRLSGGYFERRPVGKLLVRFVGDANALRTWVARTMLNLPADLLLVCAAGGVLYWMHPWLGVAAISALVLTVPVFILVNPALRRRTREGRRHQTHLCGQLTQQVSLMRQIKARDAGAELTKSMDATLDDIARANVRRARLDAWSKSAAAVLAGIAPAAVLIVGAGLLQGGALSAGDLVAALWLTLLLRAPATRLANANAILQRTRVALDRIAALLNRDEEPGWDAELAAYTGPGRRVDFRRIGYREGQRWVLRNWNAAIQGPGLVVLRDADGTAASVVLDLLTRYRRPHEGRLLIDDQDVRRLHLGTLRSRLAWIDREATELDIEADSESHARCEDNTAAVDLELRWTRALDRALMRDPLMLLLEDPTSRLDESAAERLIERLRREARELLVIVASNDSRMIAVASASIVAGRAPAVDSRACSA